MHSRSSKVLENCFKIFVFTVFGYIREFEKLIACSIPLLINYICLQYFNDGDYFDQFHCCERIQITNYNITQKHNLLNATYTDWLLNNINSTCWLQNIISEGKYLWEFEINIQSINKIIDVYRDSMSQFYIGIYDSSKKNWESIQNSSTTCLCHNFGTSYLMGVRTLDTIQYKNNEPIMITPTRMLTAQFDCNHYYIRMILDFSDLTLSIYNNDLNKAVQFKIVQGNYVAGVIVGHSSYSVKLIKSCFIYNDN